MDIPEVSHRGMLVMVHQLADPHQLQLTVLNFANAEIAGTVRSEFLPPDAVVSDMFSGKEIAHVDDLHSFTVEMPAHHGDVATGRAPRRRGSCRLTQRSGQRVVHRRAVETGHIAVHHGGGDVVLAARHADDGDLVIDGETRLRCPPIWLPAAVIPCV